EEAFAIDRSVNEPWCFNPVMAQGGNKGGRLPVPVRNLRLEALTARRPAAQRRHVGLGPGLVDEDEAGRIDPAPIPGPLCPPSGDIRAFLLTGDQRLFLCVSPSARMNSHIER